MSGWIKIYREITQHWIFQDAEKFKWWIDLLIMASHEDYKTVVRDELLTLKRGQLKVSLSFLSQRWGRSKEKVLTFLRLLESDNMIERASDRKSTTITICNYDSYQEVVEQTPTATRPISDQSPTEYKNVEECKEIYNSSTAHTCEEEFIRIYREEGDSGMWSNTALVLHKNIPACKDLFERWIVEYQHNGETHRDYTDFKKHFINWARITISKESRQQSNGNNRSDNSRRGRADVPADISVDF